MGYNYIVIGSNYGDEGKGRATRYISKLFDPAQVITIKHNGGPQMGHTSEGFVFHTFGSSQTDTYLAPTFLFNPKSIKEEIEKYKDHFHTDPSMLYVNQNCRVTTPIDILMNHVIEVVRSKNKHGSCGLGIYATITRHKYIPITVGDLFKMKADERKTLTEKLSLHYSGYEHAVRFIPEEYKDLDLKAMMRDFYQDFDEITNPEKNIIKIIDECDEELLLKKKECRIFETGQGLMLDEDCKESFPHVTPSHTNSINPIQIIKRARLNSAKDETVSIYCTRTYLTKHGAGEIDLPLLEDNLATEFKKLDTTNVPNEWQDSIRLYRIDLDAMKERVRADKIRLSRALTSYKNRSRYFITWADVTNKKFLCHDGTNKPITDIIDEDEIFNLDEVK